DQPDAVRTFFRAARARSESAGFAPAAAPPARPVFVPAQLLFLEAQPGMPGLGVRETADYRLQLTPRKAHGVAPWLKKASKGRKSARRFCAGSGAGSVPRLRGCRIPQHTVIAAVLAPTGGFEPELPRFPGRQADAMRQVSPAH